MLRQFIAIAIAFALMPLWSKKKLGFGPMLLLTGLILSLIAGLAPKTVLTNLANVFLYLPTFKTIIVVLLVGVLGTLMKHYGILDKIVVTLKELISSQKTIVMVLPAVIGLLSVPGGAQLSIPFVDKIGEEIGMPGDIRAVVNLSFRHIAMFLLPTSTAIIMVATVIPGVNLYGLIGMNLGFVILMQITAYFLYVHKYQDKKQKGTGSKGEALKNLLIYLSPIYMVVVFNAAFKLEMYLCVALSLVIVLLFWGRKDIKEFFQVAFKGLSFGTFTMMIGVYFVQNSIKSLDMVMSGFVSLFNNASGVSILLVIAAASILFGVTTGLSMVPLGVILPLISSLPISVSAKLVYCFFVFVWSFLGYYFSPLHLCQLLTVKHVGCGTGPVYKQYIKLMPCLAVYSFALFYLYQFLFV